MENTIQLPDTATSFQALKRVLDLQGYEVNKHQKVLGFGVQDIRLIDVFMISPFLIYVGMQKSLANPIRIGLVGIGVATLLYNGYNYLKNKQ